MLAPHLIRLGLLAFAILLSACSKPSVENPLEAAKESLAKQEPDAALIHLRNAVAANPNSAEVRLLLGQALMQAGDLTAAVVELRRARELKADDNAVVPLLAESLQRLGQDKLLLELFGSTRLSDAGAAAKLTSILAITHFDTGRRDKANELVSTALAASPGDPSLLLTSARLKAALGDTQAALKELESIVAAHPGFDAAWTIRGSLLERVGRSADARSSYERASTINPRQPEALFARALMALADNDTKTASEVQAKLKRVWGNNPNAVYIDARLQAVAGRHEEARTTFNALLNVAPESAPILIASGINEVKLGRLVQAEAQLARAVSLVPQDGNARTLLAQVQLKMRRPDKAWNTMVPVLEAGDPTTMALVVAAQAKLFQGEPTQAEQLFRRASEKGTTDTEIRTALASGLLGIKGQDEAALRELRQLALETADPSADHRIISALLSRRSFDEALEAVATLDKKKPGDPATHELRGQVLLGKQDKDGARAAFLQALKLDPGYVPAVVQLTALDMAAGKIEAARDRARAAQKANPRDGNLLTLLGTLEAKAGAPSGEVLQLLERATQVDPENLNAWMTLLMRHFHAADMPAGVAAAQAANKALPENVRLLDVTGRIQLASGNTNQALQTYAELVRIAPKSIAGYLGQINAMVTSGNADGAARIAQRLLDLDPSSVLARRVTADVAMSRRRFDEALQIAKALQRQNAGHAAGFIIEGQVAEVQGKRQAAIAAYRAALTRTDVADTPVRLHRVLLSSGDKAGAEAAAAAWLRAHPKDALYMTYLGDTALEAGQYEDANSWYDRALALDASLVAALNNSAIGFMKSSNPLKAMERVQKALAIQPTNPEVLDTLAQIHVSQRQFEQAAAALRKAIGRATNPAPLQISLAKVLKSGGDVAGATAELRLILDKGRSHPNHGEARKLLTEIQKGT